MPPALRQSRDVTSRITDSPVQTGSCTDAPAQTALYRQATAHTALYKQPKTDKPRKRRRVTPAVRVEDTPNEVDDLHTPTYACASVLAGGYNLPPQCIARRRSNLQTVRPAVDSSLGDTQVETAQQPVTVTQTVHARPTSRYESGIPRIYDDDGLKEEQWEVTVAYPIHETTEDYKDLIAKVQIRGSPAFRKVVIQMLNEQSFTNYFLRP